MLDRAARVRADAHIKAAPPPPRAVGNECDEQQQQQQQQQQLQKQPVQQRVQFSLPRHLRDLVQAADDRGVTLLLLPQGMSARRANKSHFNRKASLIFWNVRVKFGHEAPVASVFPDNVAVSDIISSLLRPSLAVAPAESQVPQEPSESSAFSRQRQQQRVKRLPGRTTYALAGWAALAQEELGAFLRLQSPAAAPLYKRLEFTDTLQQVPPLARADALCVSHVHFLQALQGTTLVEQPELCVVQRTAWSSMNTSAAVAAAAVAAAAAAVRRVVKRRKTRDVGDEPACERLLKGDGEVAVALRVYSPSEEEEEVEPISSCGSGDDDDDEGNDDDDDEEDNAGAVGGGGSENCHAERVCSVAGGCP